MEGKCEIEPIDIADYWKVVLVVLYSFVGAASLLGNLSVVLIVVLRKEMQTVTNIFISSVSVADLVITGCSLWASPLAYYKGTWFLGKAMCMVVMAVQGASMIWVPFTLTAIAIDRYLLVASPFRRQMSVRSCFCVIVGIWIAAFAVIYPMFRNVTYIEVGCAFCLENWRPYNHLRLLYGISVLVIRSGVPLLVISWCNWKIALILEKQGTKFQRMSYNNSEIQRKQRLQTLLKAMVLIFAISSCPLDLFNVLQDLDLMDAKFIPDGAHRFIFFSSHWIAMAGNLLNPLVYAWWNENFRRQIQAIIAEIRGGSMAKRRFYNVIVSAKPTNTCQTALHPIPLEKSNGPESEILEECEGDVQV